MNNGRLSLEEYKRYGRQLIIPEIGVGGQVKLKNAKVLVIGAGGLGCPALAYLAGAGVGTIGIVDNDEVDSSNLHRQILHTTKRVGSLKSESAKSFINDLNPHVQVVLFSERLMPSNSFEFMEAFDLVLDCTDTPATRYLINDTCVLLDKPLVSASALKLEGQLTVLNFREGPCYRCIFPTPPPADSVTACGDGGILGPVVGVMGVMQATEAIKILTGAYDKHFQPFLSLYSAFGTPPWRYMKMRGRKAQCATCGDNPTVSRQSIEDGDMDYVEFCGRPTEARVDPSEQISVTELSDLLSQDAKCTVLDVRDAAQFDICSLPGSINYPLETLLNKQVDLRQEQLNAPIYVVCRFGNDSQRGVQLIKERYGVSNVFDVKGGLNEWSDSVDPLFPRY